MLDLAPRRRARRPSLTPMIDVVFLLLVFFMLAARFGVEGGLRLAPAGTAEGHTGPPRVVGIAPDGLSLNGVAVDIASLPARLAPLMDRPEDAIVLRPLGGADLQRVVDVLGALEAAGLGGFVLVE